MINKKTKSEDIKKTIKNKQENFFDDVSKTYIQTIDHGKNFGRESLEKINEVTTTGTKFIKSQPYWKSLKNSSTKIKKKSLEHGTTLKNKSPKFYKKISNEFFYFFETIVGRINLGTQYGTASLEILEKLAKLKELGILTDEEFARKKKKILDRI